MGVWVAGIAPEPDVPLDAIEPVDGMAPGSRACCDCGSLHAVRVGPHGLEYCISCLQIEDEDTDTGGG